MAASQTVPTPSSESVSLSWVHDRLDLNLIDLVSMDCSSPVYDDSANLTILNKPSSSETPKLTIWFDIDNVCYSRVPPAASSGTTYEEYGLAIRGLIRHHSIDPLDYDKNCDLAIPLEDILSPDQGLRQLLLDIDRSKARVWCITNAYKTHALRVLKIMNLSDLIEGVVSCDYTNHNFHCKPEKGYVTSSSYLYTLLEPLHFRPCSVRIDSKIIRTRPNANDLEATDFTNHLLVDDALINIVGASKIGYGSSVHFDEDSTTGNGSSSTVKTEDGTEYQRITALDQLRNLDIWKDCFLKK
ncbi:hypothetical protein PSTT_09027 [Puccinia striiformis]|uniref:Uncharacterized protein n=1 Tax=Puccinia striiformis TaxID=27350 RepID=A0A2S4VA51_9BASI|nr:hypothetical protein PSTT_09027 [Puccinia striiformis]